MEQQPAAGTAAAMAPTTAGKTATANNDSDSAALLWTLRADATGSPPPSSAVAATTATSASNSLLSATRSSTNASTMSATDESLTPTSTSSKRTSRLSTDSTGARRGPGRPRKSETDPKLAAKWDEAATTLLLRFRYDTMRNNFDSLRNNLEVGGSWVALANELSQQTNKTFDSHQCQSKLRNLKKTWRELSANPNTAAAMTNALYPLLQHYLGPESAAAAAASIKRDTLHAPARSSSSTLTTIAMEAARSADASVRVDMVATDVDATGLRLNDVEMPPAPPAPAAVAVEHSEPSDAIAAAVASVASSTNSDNDNDDDDNDDGYIALLQNTDAQSSTTRRSRKRSGSIASSLPSSPSAAIADSADALPPRKRQHRSSHVSPVADVDDNVESASIAAASASDAVGNSSDRGTTVAIDTSPTGTSSEVVVAPHVAPPTTSEGRIDASLLSVASGVRAMMEGVLATSDASSAQQLLRTEIREHKALMQTLSEQVSKQTAALERLTELLGATFSDA